MSNIWVYIQMFHDTWYWKHMVIFTFHNNSTSIGEEEVEWEAGDLRKLLDWICPNIETTDLKPPQQHLSLLQCPHITATTCGWRGSTPTWSSRASSSSSSRSSSAPCRQSCSPSLRSRFGKSSKLTWLTTRTAERKPHNLQPTVYSLQWMGVSPSG